MAKLRKFNDRSKTRRLSSIVRVSVITWKGDYVIFSDADLRIVNELLVPSMGTDTLAPLLHFLVRFTRAQKVLEGGSGYTTPFLAMALAENKHNFSKELQQLDHKTNLYAAELDSIIAADPQPQQVEFRRSIHSKDEWVGSKTVRMADGNAIMGPPWVLHEFLRT
jgi:hypothetical protein